MCDYTIIECNDHDDWLRMRTYGIGGSDASAIVGLNPYKSNTELFEEVSHNENRILRSKKYPFMQASLDGELVDENGRNGVLEIKTSNILQSMQREKWNNRIPDNYYIQVLHYLLVTGYDFAVLCAHLRSDYGTDRRTTVKHYFIERSEVQDDLNYLLGEEYKFWKYVESGRKPPLILPEI